MNFGLIILILFLLTLITTIITFGVLFLRKQRLQMKFIMADKSISVKNLRGNIGKEQTFMNGIYFIDDQCMLKKFWGNEIWYYHGNPNPINFNFDKNIMNIVGTKAQDLKAFHDSDLVQKLFSTENLEKLLMILIFVNIGLTIVSIVTPFIVGNNNPVELANSANNTQIISNAVKIALKGG